MKKKSESSSVRVILDDSIKKPRCKHGPTLLFESINEPVKFFACSACRSREDCPFYHEFTGETVEETNVDEDFSNLVTYDEVFA